MASKKNEKYTDILVSKASTALFIFFSSFHLNIFVLLLLNNFCKEKIIVLTSLFDFVKSPFQKKEQIFPPSNSYCIDYLLISTSKSLYK